MEQNGREKWEKHNISDDHQKKEVKDGYVVLDSVRAAIGTNPLVHGPVPIFPHNDNEDCGEGKVDVVEIVARNFINARLEQRLHVFFSHNQVFILINQSNIGEKLHTEESKNEHEKEEE